MTTVHRAPAVPIRPAPAGPPTRSRRASAAAARAVTGAAGVAMAMAFAAATGPEHQPASTTAPAAVEIFAHGCAAVPTHGSGVALGGARVATVAHVVAGATTVDVIEGGRSHRAGVVAIDTNQDVAVLQVDGWNQPVPRTAELRVGDRGTFVGFGRDSPSAVSFTVAQATTIISEDIYVKGEHNRPGYRLDANVVAGDSGAGLVRTDGTLGGIVWATSRGGDGRGWGIGIDAITALAATASADPAPTVACA